MNPFYQLLMGYSMSRGELGLQLTQQEKQFAQFQKWIQGKKSCSSSDIAVCT
ncbi:hypothetical protein [Dolichospermum sp. UHCC 0259]|uniref:hypothetical protein n=1 Tax=Dolichospermum sp. UHCC 0259 TaxID=2590010 RepID=UPI001C2D7FE3|nr:hypothetical protein [Dolichospermum sp. UHCC 0259]